MGTEAEEIYKTFNLTEAEENCFDTVLSKFDNYFKPQVNVIRMRRIFQRRIQMTNETEETYYRALYKAAEECEFGALKKERIRDQSVYVCVVANASKCVPIEYSTLVFLFRGRKGSSVLVASSWLLRFQVNV